MCCVAGISREKVTEIYFISSSPILDIWKMQLIISIDGFHPTTHSLLTIQHSTTANPFFTGK